MDSGRLSQSAHPKPPTSPTTTPTSPTRPGSPPDGKQQHHHQNQGTQENSTLNVSSPKQTQVPDKTSAMNLTQTDNKETAPPSPPATQMMINDDEDSSDGGNSTNGDEESDEESDDDDDDDSKTKKDQWPAHALCGKCLNVQIHRPDYEFWHKTCFCDGDAVCCSKGFGNFLKTYPHKDLLPLPKTTFLIKYSIVNQLPFNSIIEDVKLTRQCRSLFEKIHKKEFSALS